MSHSSLRRRWIAGAATAALTITPLAVLGSMAPAHAATVDVQILGTNDFHGRLLPNTSNGAQEAGAAQFAGAVAQLRADNPNTVFAAAGDLIGASTFESFIQEDKPTLDALNAAGLDVSSAGNHEFDQGYHDLVDRVMAPYDATTNEFGGAEWQYLAANVRKKSDGSYALPDVAASPGTSDGGTWMTSVGGVDVGFVGVVTEDLMSLVAAGGMTDVEVTGIIDETNAAADALTAAGADLVVMLMHEGALSTDISSLTDDSKFAQIVAGVDSDVDAIVSGHTHLAYNHVVDGRPVVSAGQYGSYLNQLVFTVDTATDSVALKTNEIVQANTVSVTDPAAVQVKNDVQALVSDAQAEADVLGARELGQLAAPFNRAKLASGSENRGGESTLGNLVAEVQRWATSAPEFGSAQIAFMNPGGLRQDMIGNNAGGYPAVLTYKQAAVVQPFANTLINMDMTGSQIKTVLEQQWQRDAGGNIPSRPFLRLGTSSGFRYTYDVTRPEGDRITGMWLNGVRLRSDQTYSVTANSFLASGTGDNFWGFAAATNKRDSGQIDLAAMVDYMAANSPVDIDPQQHAVGVALDAASYLPGQTATVNVSSLAFSTEPDPKDSSIEVFFDGVSVGTAPVDNAPSTVIGDENGKASLSFTVPDYADSGRHTVRIEGQQTATVALAPLFVAKAEATVSATVVPTSVPVKSGRATVTATVSADGVTPTGSVIALDGETVVGAAELVDGVARIRLTPFETVGTKTLTLRYSGDDALAPGDGSVSVEVVKAKPRLRVVAPAKVRKGVRATFVVTVSAAGFTPTGTVTIKRKGKTVTRKLRGGQAVLKLAFRRVGKNKVTITYSGDSLTRGARVVRTVRVIR